MSLDVLKRLRNFAKRGLIDSRTVDILGELREDQLRLLILFIFSDLVILSPEQAQRLVQAASQSDQVFEKALRNVASELARRSATLETYLRLMQIAMSRWFGTVRRIREQKATPPELIEEWFDRFVQLILYPAIRYLALEGGEAGLDVQTFLSSKIKRIVQQVLRAMEDL